MKVTGTELLEEVKVKDTARKYQTINHYMKINTLRYSDRHVTYYMKMKSI